MKFVLDTDEQTITCSMGEETTEVALYSKEAFELLSQLWLKIGWNQRYTYTFSWLGRPIIQLPEDMVRVQEVIYRVKPDVIVETGVAHGGTLVFYASLCKAMNKGRVIGVDIEIRQHNRKEIEAHELSPLITLIEGSSIEPKIVNQVKSLVLPGESALVLLDSAHDYDHVLAELEAYHQLVTPGSYIVATDGIMKDLYDVPRGKPQWASDNPFSATAEFVSRHPEFALEHPQWPFNESELRNNVTHWPGGWLLKKR